MYTFRASKRKQTMNRRKFHDTTQSLRLISICLIACNQIPETIESTRIECITLADAFISGDVQLCVFTCRNLCK